MASRRKICVVTGTRAEYGLLYWLMREIQDDPELELQIIATGMHLSPDFGLTYRIIEEDGFLISAKVEMLLSSDTVVGITKAVGLGVIGFADAYSRLQPDIVVVLGDRYEILAATQAAMIANIPVAHISGGEVTEGVIDESIRHSITKMAQLHFVATDIYRHRVIQMGEQPERVLNVGDPGLDNLTRINYLSRADLEQDLSFRFGEANLLVTYHPVTLQESQPGGGITALFEALDEFPEVKVIITKPNSDAGSRAIIAAIDRYAAARKGRVLTSTSLGRLRYLSAMRICDAVVGNSSSGIVEAPGMGKPTVNIGDRQRGRLKANSIIDCTERREDIAAAITKALSPEFKKLAANVTSLYGIGDASKAIKNKLKETNLNGILQKRFFDINFTF